MLDCLFSDIINLFGRRIYLDLVNYEDQKKLERNLLFLGAVKCFNSNLSFFSDYSGMPFLLKVLCLKLHYS